MSELNVPTASAHSFRGDATRTFSRGQTIGIQWGRQFSDVGNQPKRSPNLIELSWGGPIARRQDGNLAYYPPDHDDRREPAIIAADPPAQRQRRLEQFGEQRDLAQFGRGAASNFRSDSPVNAGGESGEPGCSIVAPAVG